MISCVCHNVSDKTIKKIVGEKAVTTIRQLQTEVAVCQQCKVCACDIQSIIKKTHLEKFGTVIVPKKSDLTFSFFCKKTS